MEKLQEAVRQLTGAINAQIESTKEIDRRLQRIESEKSLIETATLTGAINAQIESTKELDRRLQKIESEKKLTETAPIPIPLQSPRNEEELKETWKLPDCVRELQIFDGNPTNYVSWVHNVETILKDYEIVRHRPIYRAILQSIRQKIRGPADSALISYNLFGDDWLSIKKCLSLHYADKRDIRTLEHQLSMMTQGNMSLDEYYANVNHQFSLIVNKLKTEDYSIETVNALIETYRNRALDVFIRGVNGDLSKMLIVQRPQTLPEAYTSCLEIQNLNFRNVTIRKSNMTNSITAPINQFFMQDPRHPPKPAPRMQPKMLSIEQRNKAFHIQHEQRAQPPPRPSQPKPPVPMEVDRSIQTRQVNYINRPYENYALKGPNNSTQRPFKTQRINVLELNQEPPYEEYVQAYHDEISEDYVENDMEENDEENAEVNFMTETSLAFHT